MTPVPSGEPREAIYGRIWQIILTTTVIQCFQSVCVRWIVSDRSAFNRLHETTWQSEAHGIFKNILFRRLFFSKQFWIQFLKREKALYCNVCKDIHSTWDRLQDIIHKSLAFAIQLAACIKAFPQMASSTLLLSKSFTDDAAMLYVYTLLHSYIIVSSGLKREIKSLSLCNRSTRCHPQKDSSASVYFI